VTAPAPPPRSHPRQPEGTGRGSPRLRRNSEQTRICQERAYTLHTAGCLTFDRVAASVDPTGTGPTLYANAAAARQAYLSHATRVRGTADESPLTVRERRALTDDRYERLLQTWLVKAIGGSEAATMLCLRALAGQRELWGLNIRPSAPDVEETSEDIADELAQRRADSRAAARAAALRHPGARPAPAPPRT
jgi:hypothetical protein